MINIQDTFTFTDPVFGQFSDAIVLPQADYNALKASDIQALKQARFDNWVNMLKNPPPPPPIASQIANDAVEIVQLDAEVATLTQDEQNLQAQIVPPIGQQVKVG